MTDDDVGPVIHSEDLDHAFTIPRDGPLSRESWLMVRRSPQPHHGMSGPAELATSAEIRRQGRGARLYLRRLRRGIQCTGADSGHRSGESRRLGVGTILAGRRSLGIGGSATGGCDDMVRGRDPRAVPDDRRPHFRRRHHRHRDLEPGQQGAEIPRPGELRREEAAGQVFSNSLGGDRLVARQTDGARPQEGRPASVPGPRLEEGTPTLGRIVGNPLAPAAPRHLDPPESRRSGRAARSAGRAEYGV